MFIIICIFEDQPVPATSRQFDTVEAAREFVSTMNKGLSPMILNLNDFDDKKETIHALCAMAYQYLEHDGILDHRYMSAGETCLEILEKEGYVKGSGRDYKFIKKWDL